MNNEIKSIPQLIERLQKASKEEYKSIGVTLKLPYDEIEPYAHWSQDHYTRNCIVRERDFELILLCWEPGQETAIHCHGGEECWVYLLQGEIEESHFQYNSDKLVLENTSVLKSGGKSFMSDDFGYHKLCNKSGQRAISLHLYMDPIDSCTIYNDKLGNFTPKSLTYYSYNGVVEHVEV